jgi:hypothetical protein
MRRGRYIYLAAHAGALALAAEARPTWAANLNIPAPPVLTPGDGAVLVTFGGVLNAAGYNVYRFAKGTAPVLVNAQPTPYAWLIDDGGGKGLANGTPLYYWVKAVMPDRTEGRASPEAVTVPAPPLLGGLVTYTIGTLNPGTATYDPTTKVITVHASGDDFWAYTDGQTFVGMPVDGDFTIKARIPAPPTGGDPTYGKIGLEMRQSLEFGAPCAYVFASTHRNSPAEVMFEGRMGILNTNTFSGGNNGGTSTQKFPVWLMLSRQDTVVSAQQSQDGTNWIDVYDAQDFGQLEPVTYVGIGATAHDNTKYLSGKIDATSLSITSP